MDYNIVRQRNKKKNGGKGRKKKPNTGLLIALGIILFLLAVTVITLIAIMAPQGNAPSGENNPNTARTVQTPSPMPTLMPTQAPTPEPTPVMSMGTMEQIPQEIWAQMQGKSYTENGNIGYSSLMYLTMPYYDFNYEVQTGHMIVNREVADDVLNIFSELFVIKYPIEHMEPIDMYFDGLTETFDTPDRNSMGHNNTSCFYYRVVSGSGNLSNHAYGKAIDLNPKTNPWEKNGSVSPRNAVKFAQRSQTKAGTDFTGWSEADIAAFIGTDTEVYRIFKKYGWEWGGEIWGNEHDYQHFQKR